MGSYWDETWQDLSLAIAGGALWVVLNFGHQGLSLFSNPNAKLAVLGIVRGHIGIKLGRIGPWP